MLVLIYLCVTRLINGSSKLPRTVYRLLTILLENLVLVKVSYSIEKRMILRYALHWEKLK